MEGIIKNHVLLYIGCFELIVVFQGLVCLKLAEKKLYYVLHSKKGRLSSSNIRRFSFFIAPFSYYVQVWYYPVGKVYFKKHDIILTESMSKTFSAISLMY